MDPNQMMGRSFPMWAPAAGEDPSAQPPPQPPFLPPPNALLAPNRGWKRKNPSTAGYQPPALGDLQVQNRAKARRWFKSHNPNHNQSGGGGARKHFFPRPKAAAPRNTTSFIIRAKRAGGIASLVSPCPVTPAVLPTPRLSPSREGLSDMAQAQWGVDGYGSMKGLIRLRSSPPHPAANPNASDDDDDANSSGSDVEEHVEVERRLDHDLSRFEMVYPGSGDDAAGYVFEEEEEYDQDAHVARLEEENLTLKERLFLMEQELGDMRRRLEVLESRFAGTDAITVENVHAVDEDKEMTDPGSRGSPDHNVQRDDLRSEKSRESNTEVAEIADAGSANGAQDNAGLVDAGSEKSAQDIAGVAVAVTEQIDEETGLDA